MTVEKLPDTLADLSTNRLPDPKKVRKAEPLRKKTSVSSDSESTSTPDTKSASNEDTKIASKPTDLSAIIASVDEEETSEREIDDTLDVDDLQLSDPDFDEATLLVYKPHCLECSYLVAFATKKFKRCHFSQGNNDCPASGVKILIKIPTERIVKSLLRKEEEQDLAGISEWYAKLATKPDWAQTQILDALKEAKAQLHRMRR